MTPAVMIQLESVLDQNYKRKPIHPNNRIEIGKLTKFTHKQGKFLKGIRLKFMQIVQICTSLIYISPGVIQVKHRLAWIINLERQREDHPLKERCLSAYVYCICDVGIKVVCCLDHRF